MSSQLNPGKTDSKSIEPSNEFKEKIEQIFKLNNDKLNTENKQEISLEELIDQLEQILKKANLSLDDINKIVINSTNQENEKAKLSLLNNKKEDKRFDLVLDIPKSKINGMDNDQKLILKINSNNKTNLKADEKDIKENIEKTEQINKSNNKNNIIKQNESVEKLFEKAIELLKENTTRDKLNNYNKTNNSNTRINQNKNINLEVLSDLELSKKDEKTLQKLVDNLKQLKINLSEKDFNTVKNEIKNIIKTSSLKENINRTELVQKVINQIKTQQNNQTFTRDVIKKVINNLEKISNNEINKSNNIKNNNNSNNINNQKYNIENTNKSNRTDESSNKILNNTNNKIDNNIKTNTNNTKKDIDINNKSKNNSINFKTNENINTKDTVKQKTKTRQNQKTIKIDTDNLKNTSQLRKDNNLKEKITFNNLEIKYEDNNKSNYKKINNLKFLNDKSKNNLKDNLSNFKSIDLTGNKVSNQSSSNKFNQILQENNVLKQIDDKLNMKSLTNKNQVEIKLEPEVLGKMKIELSVKSNKLVGKIIVENTNIQNFLENNIQELKNNLVSKGLQVDQFNIESESKNFSDNRGNQNQNPSFQQFDERQQNSKNNHRHKNHNFNYIEENEIDNTQLEQFEQVDLKNNYSYRSGFEYFA